jgi:hypothetical protein
MYNLASILKSIISELDDKGSMELAALKNEVSGMNSLHTARMTHKTDDKKTDDKGGPMDTIPEEGRVQSPRMGTVRIQSLRMKVTWAFSVTMSSVLRSIN